jgi:antitoxin ParD1/3/4
MRRLATAGPVVMGSGLRSLCERPRNDDVEQFVTPRLRLMGRCLPDFAGWCGGRIAWERKRRHMTALAKFAMADNLSPRSSRDSDMPTRNISLTAEQDAFVESVVKAGEYQNASEAVRDALRVLQQRRREDALKLKALRAQIKAGVDALDRGDFVEVDDAELDGFLEGLATASGKRAR